MKYDEFNEREVENMRADALSASDALEAIVAALSAIDALEAILAECDSAYVSRRYLKEKTEKAKWCIGYISEVVQK